MTMRKTLYTALIAATVLSGAAYAESDAELIKLGQDTKNLRMSVHDLKVWQSMGEANGGTAKDVTDSLYRLKNITHTMTVPSVEDPQGEHISSCALVVDGKQYIKGPCEFFSDETLSGGKADFVIAQKGWFAWVTTDERSPSYWNEDEGSNHAYTPLGVLMRNRGPEGCWSNAHATVCAKR